MPKKAKESPSELKLRAKKIYTGLNKLYPNAHCELDFKNPLKNMSNSIDVLIACYNEGPTYNKVDLEHLLKQFDSNFDLLITKSTNKVEIYA